MDSTNDDDLTEQPRLTLTDVPENLQEKILSLGGNPNLNLYKTLAHHPTLLSSWIDFAYSLRHDCRTSRQLRELMILRGAQLCQSNYEWFQHEQMAKQCGITMDKINAIQQWRESSLFDARERIVLTLMEVLIDNGGKMTDELDQELKKHFPDDEYLELVLTGSFYAMVPRVLTSLRIPIEK